MSVISVLRPALVTSLRAGFLNAARRPETAEAVALKLQPFRQITTSLVRNGERTMQIIPSRYQWQRYKDLFHFYVFLGVIPLSALVFYCNIFIGKAVLTEIPPGYRPKHWEYERHPISRFMSRYLQASFQERYELNLFYINEFDELKRLRRISAKVLELMSERGDYPNYYVSKYNYSKYLRSRLMQEEEIENYRGDN